MTDEIDRIHQDRLTQTASTPPQEDKLPKDCGVCGYHLSNKECRRHSPHPVHTNEFGHVVALWNFTHDRDKCGSGTSIKTIVTCDDCVHWDATERINPDYKDGKPDEWWAQAHYCRANPPGATAEEGLWTYWKVTSSFVFNGTAGGCGDGISITALKAAAAKKAAAKPPPKGEMD